ncbi:MAG: ribonuclease E activity regulator RraA [Pseudomonadales bacterium]
MNISTPDLCDAHPQEVQVCELAFNGYGQQKQFGGQIETVKCFEDNSLVKEALARDGAGKVLVVDGGGSMRRALLGDQIAASAVKNQWTGMVFYGCVRDVEEIDNLPIGVKALGSVPVKTDKRGEGQTNIALRFGGVIFTPGHFLYADRNGVIIAETSLL